ncbi:branched-chain amino acid transport system permease protein [Geothermobacter ehrlichii]|uniref:Branched-chain amino acid transport system permease protein n=1 Tax=Geothermobacter ehrlichii TaxID=213224 RepID=A0A5D3WH97_9BACT|nr:branched-chain amino acid ABC transporter permease [Geothermobacter ehrlichii]TYO97153.1 branched-chain amino acid transport system permease protein [Geothermobacter ehrlichii]
MFNVLKRSVLVALWFVFLTFPLMVVKVNTLKNIVEWRWLNMLWVFIVAFFLHLFWRWALDKRQLRSKKAELEDEGLMAPTLGQRILQDPRLYRPLLGVLAAVAILFPWILDVYQVNIMVLALIFVVLGLGLNITVGLAGLLDLGYVAFFAVGAYSYALIHQHFPVLGFWACLPIGGLIGALFGVVLGFPILRLRGDYLAIVTLGFGSIAKIVIENWEEVTNGAKGIANIPRPGFFGMEMSIGAATTYTYYLMILMVIFTIFVTNRLKDSRIGRAWMALREDEIACVAMGVDMARTKLSAYALGAFWAGAVGVIFAARNTYINPNSFTFMESAIVLSIVVLGGMGSIVGVIIAALILILMPEYLRAFADYRMLVFGAVMVLMMIFRPQGLIANVRKTYAHRRPAAEENNG